jgi:hypothetical protein
VTVRFDAPAAAIRIRKQLCGGGLPIQQGGRQYFAFSVGELGPELVETLARVEVPLSLCKQIFVNMAEEHSAAGVLSERFYRQQRTVRSPWVPKAVAAWIGASLSQGFGRATQRRVVAGVTKVPLVGAVA